ncbi:hypothetical protein [Ascidiimonas sp. W6]|uniref:hypothetical protein n=1 Tax=Ascidiimonas meishanensis TaxID=3128903 RepID=UPI0030EC11B4
MARLDCEGTFDYDNNTVSYKIKKNTDENFTLFGSVAVRAHIKNQPQTKIGFILLLMESEEHDGSTGNNRDPEFKPHNNFQNVKRALKKKEEAALIVILDDSRHLSCYKNPKFSTLLINFIQNEVSVPNETGDYINKDSFKKMIYKYLLRCLKDKPFIDPPKSVGNGGVLRPS